MLKTFLTTVAMGALSLTSAFAQAQPATLEEATQGDSNVAIWKTGDEDTTVYMMGTVHILQPGLQWETDAFEKAWAKSDAVFFEADVMSPEAQQAIVPVVMSLGLFTDGTTLASLFTDEEKATVNETLATFGLTLEALGNMRPWLASIQLSQLALQTIGADPTAGIEMLLNARAVEEGKPTRFLETGEQQLTMIAGIDDAVWAKSLVIGVEDLNDLEGYFAQMVGLWYKGDADGLAAFMTEAWAETPSLKTTLLDQRNEDWANQLDTLIKEEEGTFLIAVGAAHLAGEGSVQDYLSAKGHESTRVNP